MVVPKIQSAHNSEARNIINKAIEVLNVQGKTIQDLVAEGQLTDEQYSNLITTVNGMIKSGEVDRVDLTPELRSEVDKVRNKIDKGEVSVYDIDKNKGKLDQTYLTQGLIDAITGAPGANILSEVADGSVTTNKVADKAITGDKVNFLEQSINLFSGDFLRVDLSGVKGSTAKATRYDNARTAYAKISSGQTYTIKVHDENKANRFRVAVHSELPSFEASSTTLDELVEYNDVLKEYTFTSSISGYVFVYVSQSSDEPRLQIEEGGTASDYVSGFKMREEYLPTTALDMATQADEKADTALTNATEALDVANSYQEVSRNLFDGTYYPWLVTGSASSAQIYDTSGVRRTAVVPIESGQTYSIKVHEPDLSDSFRAATHTSMPSFDSNGYDALTTLVVYNDVLDEYTFTADVTGYVFVTVSRDSQEPKLQVEEGAVPTDYISHKIARRALIEPIIEDSPAISNTVYSMEKLNEKASEETLFPKVISSEMIPTDPGPRFIEYFDGRMWGYTYSNGDLSYSEDQGTTWVYHTNKGATISGSVHRLLPTNDGEVLAMSSSGLYKSSGWASGNVTWTESKITKHANATLFQFGFDGDGTKFIIAEYGASITNWPDSRNVWISTDMGETFSVVWDSLEENGAEINDTTHLHGACYDRWGDRFYFSEGHGRSGGLYCSTDDGATWVQGQGHRDGVLKSSGISGHQYESDTNGPTVIVATPDGLVMGSDNNLNGIFGLVRKDNPEDEVVRRIYKAEYDRPGLIMFAIRGYYDVSTNSAYISFRAEFDDVPPIICAGTPTSADLMYEYPDLPVVGAQDHFGAIARLDDDTLVAYAQFSGSPNTFRATLGYANSEIKSLIRLELKELGLI